MYLFAYGLLTHPSYMMGFRGRPAQIKNSKFDFHYFANVAEGYTTVHGVLWEVDTDKIEQLDLTEGTPNLYERIIVQVECSGEIVDAFMYTMTDETIGWHKNEPPSEKYLKTLEYGYQHFELPTDQLFVYQNN
jgi:gamma-glutamylcyclotransferase (GGCT)/AIG2-like uncharacterized protein YtfP